MLRTKLSNILNDLISIGLPRLCFGCNVRLYRGEQALCTFCRDQLPLTEYSFNDENPVDRIFYGRTDVKKASAFLFYSETGLVKNMIHNLKYRNQPQIGSFLGNWYGCVLAEEIGLKKVDFVVPVPLHHKKLKKRGYNQVDLFAQSIARQIGTVYHPDALIKTANTKTQTTKKRFSRWLSASDLYELREPGELKGKHVLLVDDVITTGATMEACSNALLKASGATVSVASMAVVP